MESGINRLAPNVTNKLSDKVIEAVRHHHKGEMSDHACSDEDILRRDKEHDAATVLRPAFVRDCEKILHMPLYNRLVGKTQVFSFRANDDLCRRGLHVQLVSRVARDIGRALGLNLDLIDAIALGHDIGHTPFGHAGEHYLNKIYEQETGRHFFHNVQSVRMLDVLGGRNLSLQTLDGVLCHNGEFEQRVIEMDQGKTFSSFDADVERCWQDGNEAIKGLRPMTLEGCCVRLADIIAYVGKDRQDAIRAGVCSEDDFEDGLGGRYNAWALGALVADIVENSIGKPQLQMSDEAFREMSRAKRENYEKIYLSKEVDGDFSDQVSEVFSHMYHAICDDLKAGREDSPVFRHHLDPVAKWLAFYGRSYDWEDDLNLTCVDFISSMTDNYFMAYACELDERYGECFPTYPHYFRDVRHERD